MTSKIRQDLMEEMRKETERVRLEFKEQNCKLQQEFLLLNQE